MGYLRKLLLRGAAPQLRFSVSCTFREPTPDEWTQRTFAGRQITAVFKGLQMSLENDDPSALAAREGGAYGHGAYCTADPRLALAYTRTTRDAALTAIDHKPRVVLMALCDMSGARGLTRKKKGAMTSPIVISSPPNALPGIEICIRNAQRRSLVIAKLDVTLLEGAFPHVGPHAASAADDPLTPLVVGTRPRWPAMPGYLL